MLQTIASRCQTVESVLSGAPIRVPDFQRGYAWQVEHAGRLTTDLMTYAARQGALDWYPLGIIILAGNGSGAETASDTAAVDVADGHQRLITLTILLSVLRDLETDAALRARLAAVVHRPDGTPRFATQSGAAGVLARAVQSDSATLQPLDTREVDLSPSEHAILENAAHIRSLVGPLSADVRQALARFVLERTYLVVVAVQNDAAARILF